MKTCIFVFASLVLPSVALAGVEKDTQKPVKVLINAIRYKKDDLARKQIDFDAMTKGILQDVWGKLSDADKKFFTDGLTKIISTVSFKAGRDSFQHLDAITYGAPKVKGDVAQLPSNIVIDHPIKGRQELKITWVLKKGSAKWRVFDTIILGESTVDGVREDQVELLLEEGGIPRVKKAMKDKLAEIGG